ncbi:MAG TPA: ABC transporter permease [Phototrophicaceae bacterium]|nr:ABC transporter permease [Phototrophicaceae bacterium]
MSETPVPIEIPAAISDVNEPEAQIVVAKQWQLIWWKFRRHRLALLGGIITILIYLVAIFAEFLAPFTPDMYASKYTYAPPQPIHIIDYDASGNIQFAPFVNGYKVVTDYAAGRRNFVTDPTVKIPIGFFVHGTPYKLIGIFNTDIHLIGPLNQSDPMYILGADHLGRDMLSRTLYGTRVSVTIGLVGVAISLFLGILLGGISGYFGGWLDILIQRVIEFLNSIPSIPLWLALAAAIPADIPPLTVYFLITIILSVIGWTGLARVVRGRFYALKTEDFVKAAQLDGCSPLRIILRHMVPSFMSHIIAVVTLAIPGMILAETALSFLGIGLREPIISWGVLLQEAQNIRAIAQAPWLFWPGVAVVVTVLSLNFLGDGLRDAADPYAH